MVFPIIAGIVAIPCIYLGGWSAIWVTGVVCRSLYKRSNAYKYFEIYLKKNRRLQQNIEKLINDYKSTRQHIQIDIKAFYGALYILFFYKPQKTRRLKGSNCDFSIAYMIQEYLENPNDKNKNNLFQKIVQYHKTGSLLNKEVYGIPIILLLIVFFNLSRILSEDKKTFFIEFKYKTDSLKMGPYLNNLYERLFY